MFVVLSDSDPKGVLFQIPSTVLLTVLIWTISSNSTITWATLLWFVRFKN